MENFLNYSVIFFIFSQSVTILWFVFFRKSLKDLLSDLQCMKAEIKTETDRIHLDLNNFKEEIIAVADKNEKERRIQEDFSRKSLEEEINNLRRSIENRLESLDDHYKEAETYEFKMLMKACCEDGNEGDYECPF